MISLTKKMKMSVKKGLISKSIHAPSIATAPSSTLVVKLSTKEILFHSIGELVVIPSGSIPRSQSPSTTITNVPSWEVQSLKLDYASL